LKAVIRGLVAARESSNLARDVSTLQHWFASMRQAGEASCAWSRQARRRFPIDAETVGFMRMVQWWSWKTYREISKC